MKLKNILDNIIDLQNRSIDEVREEFVEIMDNVGSDDLYIYYNMIKNVLPNISNYIFDEYFMDLLYNKDSLLYSLNNYFKHDQYIINFIDEFFLHATSDDIENLLKNLDLENLKHLSKHFFNDKTRDKIIRHMFYNNYDRDYIAETTVIMFPNRSFEQLFFKMNNDIYPDIFNNIFKDRFVETPIMSRILDRYIAYINTHGLDKKLIDKTPDIFNFILNFMIISNNDVYNNKNFNINLNRLIDDKVIKLFDKPYFLLRDIMISSRLGIDINLYKDDIDHLKKSLPTFTDKDKFEAMKHYKNGIYHIDSVDRRKHLFIYLYSNLNKVIDNFIDKDISTITF